MLFHIIPEAQAIIRTGGIYRQVKVYRRRTKNEDNDRIYVAYGSGYVYLCRQGTSVPKLHWEEIDLPFKEEYNSLGRMVVPTSYKPEKDK